jgi:hypothetical protein
MIQHTSRGLIQVRALDDGRIITGVFVVAESIGFYDSRDRSVLCQVVFLLRPSGFAYSTIEITTRRFQLWQLRQAAADKAMVN